MNDVVPDSAAQVRIEPYGDSAVMIVANHDTKGGRRRDISRTRERILAQPPHGSSEVIAGLESLLVSYDPLVTSCEDLRHCLATLISSPLQETTAPRSGSFRIPVVFDEQTGPDLPGVCAELGITKDELIDRVCSSPLEIALLGAAMAPMMDGLDVPTPIRRRTTPRTNVVPGSVMVASTNAIIQPFPGPSGWRVIGRTPCRLVDIQRPNPITYGPGDRVRFESISDVEAAAIDGILLQPREDS